MVDWDGALQDYVDATLGLKSPNTVIKRAGAILQYFAWHASRFQHDPTPFSEQDVWTYVTWLSAWKVQLQKHLSYVKSLLMGAIRTRPFEGFPR